MAPTLFAVLGLAALMPGAATRPLPTDPPQVASTVVIVRDEASYLGAIATWTPSLRFPVLLHDGSIEAAEDIARFVRAFSPDQVVEYSSDTPWPPERDARIRTIERAFFDASSDRVNISSMREWSAAGLRASPGLVVSDPDDPLWTAALALAAGRLQPIVFTRSPGRINNQLALEEAQSLEAFLREACIGLSLDAGSLGDDVDFVTLALAVPVKTRPRPDNPDLLATTDLLGRPDNPAARWAYVGQLLGSSARGSYIAMSSLFPNGTSAWLFDAYPNEPGWSDYDATAAADTLRTRGWRTTLFDDPRQSLDIWRAAAVRPIDADLVLVNSMGNPEFFRLRPGDAAPGDVPLLARPAVVHFIHSFSLARPADRDTVGGRWLAHGAHAYFGSVQEPQLAAFLPTPRVAAALSQGVPLAVAVRRPDQPPWKLALLADPMLSFAPTHTRASRDIPLEFSSSLNDAAAEAVASHNFADAIANLALLGRDADAARLAAALRTQQPDAFTPDVARAAFMPTFRTRAPEDTVATFRLLAPVDQAQGLFLDALWHAARLRVYADPAITDLLRSHLRPGQIAADALELAGPISHQIDMHAAAAFLTHIKPRITEQRDLRLIDRRIEQLMRGTPQRP